MPMPPTPIWRTSWKRPSSSARPGCRRAATLDGTGESLAARSSSESKGSCAAACLSGVLPRSFTSCPERSIRLSRGTGQVVLVCGARSVGSMEGRMSAEAEIEARIQGEHARGDHSAAATLVISSYGNEILAFLISRLRSASDADEVFATFAEKLWLG